MSLLTGFRVVQIGQGLAAAVCGRLLADVGADVGCIEPDRSTLLTAYLNHGKRVVARDVLATADLIVCEGRPAELRSRQCDAEALHRLNAGAALVLISPFGQIGPRANDPASDLTLMYSSGIARLLTGQVDDLSEAPIRPVGEQSAFIGGLAAACAGMHAAQLNMQGAIVDVSIEEALATMAMGELTSAGLHGRSRSRKRVTDGNGATVCILPARDGYAGISPREDRQWASWLVAMGSPGWGNDPRFATKPDRVANWDALHALMSAWSRQHDKRWIADTAQAARVPSFPLRELSAQFESPQLAHRGFWRAIELDGRAVKAPGPPFGLTMRHGMTAATGAVVSPPIVMAGEGRPSTSFRDASKEDVDGGAKPHHDDEAPAVAGAGALVSGQVLTITPAGAAPSRGSLPLSGVHVLDFSWVIAGPTTTRYLAAMGADVIKVEAPGRGDPGRASELHTVLGQAKRGIVLDLKQPEAVDVARSLAEQCDVLVENFATGVMDRLGLGAAALQQRNPELIYVSASGLGRTGPESHAVAYGTLLQCYAGFAGLNRHPEVPPRVGFAWLDPMCGLMLAFIVAAAIWQRRSHGGVARIDFSMIEAMLWTMAEPLLAAQSGAPPAPQGNRSDRHKLHGAYRCAGDDEWIAIAVNNDAERHGLRDVVSAEALSGWLRTQAAPIAADRLRRAGVPAAALASSLDLLGNDHLRERGFWDAHDVGVLPGLPWCASFGRRSGEAPGLGADTDAVLAEVLGLSGGEIAALRDSGALG
ncbi:MAG TPA: CoA transferase [Acetobacteraceae bacterium]|nr:CoA transferase [Acetobacteraceae bacterium]